MSELYEICGDDRFELIDKAKAKLMKDTNIEMRPDEMAVLDSILFRCWQMGWLDKLRDDGTRYSELFGTPERAAQTMAGKCGDCCECVLVDACGYGKKCLLSDKCDYDMLLEWLESEVSDD